MPTKRRDPLPRCQLLHRCCGREANVGLPTISYRIDRSARLLGRAKNGYIHCRSKPLCGNRHRVLLKSMLLQIFDPHIVAGSRMTFAHMPPDNFNETISSTHICSMPNPLLLNFPLHSKLYCHSTWRPARYYKEIKFFLEECNLSHNLILFCS